MKAADGGQRVGESRWDRPIRSKQLAGGNRAAVPKVADVLIAEDSSCGPGKQIAAVEFNESIGAGITPGTDGDAMQCGEMGAAADEPAEIAGQGADVISSADRHSQLTGAREVVTEPACFVEIDLRGGQIDCFAAVGLEIGALAVDSFGAGGRRRLIVPADETRQGVVELSRVKSGWVAGECGAAMEIAVVRFDAPSHGGVVNLGDGVQVIEQARGGLHENEQQAAGEGVERSAVTNLRIPFCVLKLGGLDARLHERKARGSFGFVKQVNAGAHWA